MMQYSQQRQPEPVRHGSKFSVEGVEAYDLTCVVVPRSSFESGASRISHIMDPDMRRAVEFLFAASMASNGLGSNASGPTFVTADGKRERKVRMFAECLLESPVSLSLPSLAGLSPNDLIWEGMPSLYGHTLPGTPCGSVNGRTREQVEQTPNSTYDYMGAEDITRLLEGSWDKEETDWSWQKLFYGGQGNGRLLVSLYEVLQEANCAGIRFWLVSQDPELTFNDVVRGFVCRCALSVVGKAAGADRMSGIPNLPPCTLEANPEPEPTGESAQDEAAAQKHRQEEATKELFRDLFGKFYSAEQRLIEAANNSRFAPPFDARSHRLIATFERYYTQIVNVVVNKAARGEAPHWDPGNPGHPQLVDLCDASYNIRDVVDPGSPMSWLPWGIECGNVPAGKVCAVQRHVPNYVRAMEPRAQPPMPVPVPSPVTAQRLEHQRAQMEDSRQLTGILDTGASSEAIVDARAGEDEEDDDFGIPVGHAVAPVATAAATTTSRVGPRGVVDDGEEEREERQCFLFSIPLSILPIEIDTSGSPSALREKQLTWTAQSPFECLMGFRYQKCVESEQSRPVDTLALSGWASAYAQHGQAAGFSRHNQGVLHEGIEAHMRRFVDEGERQCQSASETLHITPMNQLELLRVENGRWRHMMDYLCQQERFSAYVSLMHTSFLEHAVGRFSIAISPNSDVPSSIHSIASYVRNNERTLIKPKVTALAGLGLRNSSYVTMVTKLRGLFKMSSTMRQLMKLLLVVYNVYSDPVTDYKIRNSRQKLSVALMAAPGAGKSFIGEVLRSILIPGSELPSASWSEQSLSNHEGMRHLYLFMDEACRSLTRKDGKGNGGPSLGDWKMLLSAGETSRTKTMPNPQTEKRRTETYVNRHAAAFIICSNDPISDSAVDDRIETVVPPTVSASYLPVDHQPSEMDETTKTLRGVFVEEQCSQHALVALANLMIGCGVLLPPEMGMDKELYSGAIHRMCEIDPSLGKKNRNATRVSIVHMQRAILDAVDILSSEASPEVYYNPEYPDAPPSVRPFSLLRFAAFMGPNMYSRTETAENNVADVVDQTYNKDLHELSNMLAQDLGNFSYCPPKEELERIRVAGPEEKKQRVATLFPPDMDTDPTRYLNMFSPESLAVANQTGVVRPGCRYRKSVLDTDMAVPETADFLRVVSREGLQMVDPNWVQLREMSMEEVVQYAVKNFRGVPIDRSVAEYMLGKLCKFRVTYHPYNLVLDANALRANTRTSPFSSGASAPGIRGVGLNFDAGASDCTRQQNERVTEYAMRVVEVSVGKGKKQQRVHINTAYLELTPSSVVSQVLEEAAFANTTPHFFVSPTSPLQYPELSQLFYVTPVDRKRRAALKEGVDDGDLALMGYRPRQEKEQPQDLTEEREVFYARKHWAKFPHVPQSEKWRYLSSQVDQCIRETQANHPHFEAHRRATAPSPEDRERAQVLSLELDRLAQQAYDPKGCASASEWALAVKKFEEKAMQLDLIQAGYPVPQIRAKREARLRKMQADLENSLMDRSKHPYHSRILGEEPSRGTEPAISRDRFGYDFAMAVDRGSILPPTDEIREEMFGNIEKNHQLWTKDIAPNIPSVIQRREADLARAEYLKNTPQAVAEKEKEDFIDLTEDEIVGRVPFVFNFTERRAADQRAVFYQQQRQQAPPPSAGRGSRRVLANSSSSSVFGLPRQRRSPESLRQSAPVHVSPPRGQQRPAGGARHYTAPLFEEEEFLSDEEVLPSAPDGAPAEKRPRYS